MVRGKLKVQDVAEVFLHFADGTTKLFGCMDTTSIEKTFDTEDIRCGIGWGLSSILYSNPDMMLTLTPAYWNEVFMEAQSGTTFSLNQSTKIWTYEVGTLAAASANATVSITGTPDANKVYVQTENGVYYPATFAAGVVTVTGQAALAGKKVTVSYQKTATGDVLTFKSTNLPQVMGLTLHTVAYDVDTNAIVSDIYFTFDKVLTDGNFSYSLTGATNNRSDMMVKVLPNASQEFGKYISVDRV